MCFSDLIDFWPFIVIIVLFIIGNELVRSRYGKLTLQFSAFFVAVFLYTSFAVPILMHQVGTVAFIISGLVSLGIIILVGRLTRFFARERFEQSRVGIWMSVLFLYAGFNFLYFQNLIPPLPLSLKEIGIYHSVARDTSGSYVLTYEPAKWYTFRTIDSTFHLASSTSPSAVAFSSIFAPSGITTRITHQWSRFDPISDVWISMEEVSFNISGGRDAGYRGYSVGTSLTKGLWRVDVETETGALIGRTTFSVEESGIQPVLKLQRR